MNKKKETICAVVVTYNRKKLLIECLESLLKQTYPLDAILIVDNASTDGTPELLKEKGYIKELPPKNLNQPWKKEFIMNNSFNNKSIKIHYIRMHENTGGAGGFHEGVKRGYEKGYDWLWLMDDDTYPTTEALNELIKKRRIIKEKIGALQSQAWMPDGKIDKCVNIINPSIWKVFIKGIFKPPSHHIDIILVDFIAFVGCLINTEVINTIGFPEDKLFIYTDDARYGLKMKKAGYKLFLIPESKVIHRVANFGKRVSPWRKYYIYRNSLILLLDFNSTFGKLKTFAGIWRIILRALVLFIIGILTANWKLSFLIIKAIHDGFFKKFDIIKS